MAEFVMKDIVRKAGCEKEFLIESAATSTEEIGNPIHNGTRRRLREAGVPFSEHRAVQMTRADYDKYDYIIAMDQMNVRNILRITGGDREGKVSTLLSYAGSGRDIADPWYTGNFDETYDDIVEGCRAFFDRNMRSVK